MTSFLLFSKLPYLPLIFVHILTLCPRNWEIFHAFMSSADFFQNELLGIFFSGIPSNSLDPDQARHFVGPDLGPNCLQKLSADDTYNETSCAQCVYYVNYGYPLQIYLKKTFIRCMSFLKSFKGINYKHNF